MHVTVLNFADSRNIMRFGFTLTFFSTKIISILKPRTSNKEVHT